MFLLGLTVGIVGTVFVSKFRGPLSNFVKRVEKDVEKHLNGQQ